MTTLQQYIKQIAKYPVLKKDEERKLIERAQQGHRKSRDKLIVHNLQLVIYIVRRYYTWNENNVMDFIMSGNIGLFLAIDGYDLNKKTRFATYATPWIRQQVSRHIGNHGKTIRSPLYVQDHIKRIKKKMREHKRVTKTERLYVQDYDISMCSLDKRLGEKDEILYDVLEEEGK